MYTNASTWVGASQTCYLATPSINISTDGNYSVDIQNSNIQLTKGVNYWLGYHKSHRVFQYEGKSISHEAYAIYSHFSAVKNWYFSVLKNDLFLLLSTLIRISCRSIYKYFLFSFTPLSILFQLIWTAQLVGERKWVNPEKKTLGTPASRT